MCYLWHLLVNLYGLTTLMCRVGWKVCDLYHFLQYAWLQWSRPWCWFPPHLQGLRCGWFYSWVKGTTFCRMFDCRGCNHDGWTTATLLGLRTFHIPEWVCFFLNLWFFHILGEGVFSLWLVMSNVVVDVGLWVVNLESWTTSLWLHACVWALCDWRCLDIVRQVDPWYCYPRIHLRGVMKY
jgi:hypothetical protein